MEAGKDGCYSSGWLGHVHQNNYSEIVFEKDVRSKLLHQRLKSEIDGRIQAGSENSIDTGCRERVFPRDPFLVVGVDIYKQSFMLQSTVLVELVGPHYVSVEWAVTFKKEGAKEEDLKEKSSYDS